MTEEYVRAGGTEHSHNIKKRALQEAGHLRYEWESDEEYATRMRQFLEKASFQKVERK